MSEPVEIVRIPFHGTEVLAVDADGQPHIVLKPAIEGLGMDYATQYSKLRRRSWAVVGQRPTTGSDGKTYQMVTVDVRTFLMLLATVDENRVPEHVRPLLIAYQREVADAIEAYWTKGAALQPTGTETANVPAVIEVPLDDYEKLLAGGQQLIAKLRAQEQENERQRQELDEAHAYADHLEPDAEAYQNIVKDDGRDWAVKDAAAFVSRSDRRIRIGRDQLFAKLREWGLLDKWNQPYSNRKQNYVTSIPRTYPHPRTGERIEDPKKQARVTWEGLSYIRHRLLEEIEKAAAEKKAQQRDLFSQPNGDNVRALPARRDDDGGAA